MAYPEKKHLSFMRVDLTVLFVFLLFLILISINVSLYFDWVSFEVGDFASNSLLIQDAKSFDLLVGNYSRVGFNHPGPAILYFLAFGEYFFHDLSGLVQSPFSGQLLAVAIYNSLWISILALFFLKMISLKINGLLVFVISLFAIVCFDNLFFSGIWFPHLYLFPFFVVLVGMARLLEFKGDFLIPSAVATGFLINGHVAFVPLIGLMFVLTMFHNLFFKIKSADKFLPAVFLLKYGFQIILSLIIVLIFLLPIIILTIRDFPGPVLDYFTVGSGGAANGYLESLVYISNYLGGVTSFLLFILVSTFFSIMGKYRSFFVSILITTLSCFLYVKFGVDMLDQPYILYFYYSVPALFLAMLLLCILNILPFSERVIDFFKASFLVLASLLLVIGIYEEPAVKYYNLYGQDNISLLSEQISNLEDSERKVYLSLEQSVSWGDIWSTVAGIAAYNKRRGIDNFCIIKGWHISFTQTLKCDSEHSYDKSRVFYVSFPDGELLFKSILADEGISYKPGDIVFDYSLGSGWSSPEYTHVWSVGDMAKINLEFMSQKTGLIEIDISAFLVSGTEVDKQNIRIYVNDEIAGKYDFSLDHNRRVVTLPFATEDNKLNISISIEKPASPSELGLSGDERILGVSLHQFELKFINNIEE